MSCQDEEDDLIDQAIADAEWCKECDRPIGHGSCLGCIAVACSVDLVMEEDDFDDDL